MGRITAWSYSRFADYSKCPQLAKFKHVDKIREPENDAMRRGSVVHDTAAAILRGDHPGPLDVRAWDAFAPLFEELRKLEPVVEQQWGYTKQWLPTGWFGNDTWFRSVLDAAVLYADNTVDVVDHKTGKPSPSHAEQAELYAISVFIRYPAVQSATVRYWYLDLGSESVYRFERSALAGMITQWEKKVGPMLNDTVFAPKPGQHCNWCYQAKSKGGACKYG